MEKPICTTPGASSQHRERPDFTNSEHGVGDGLPQKHGSSRDGMCITADHISLPQMMNSWGNILLAQAFN